MGAVIDILIILIFLGTVIAGIRNGFLRSVLGIAAVVLTLVLCATLTPHATDVVYEEIARAPIEHAIEEEISTHVDEDIVVTKETIEEVISSLPEEFVQGAKSFGVDIDEITDSVGSMKFDSQNAAQELTQRVARPIITPVLKVIVFSALFLIINIILQIIIAIIGGIVKLPVLRTLDKLLGGVFGAVKAAIVVSFIAFFLNAFSALVPNSAFEIAVQGSQLVKFIAEAGLLTFFR